MEWTNAQPSAWDPATARPLFQVPLVLQIFFEGFARGLEVVEARRVRPLEALRLAADGQKRALEPRLLRVSHGRYFDKTVALGKRKWVASRLRAPTFDFALEKSGRWRDPTILLAARKKSVVAAGNARVGALNTALKAKSRNPALHPALIPAISLSRLGRFTLLCRSVLVLAWSLYVHRMSWALLTEQGGETR